MFLRIGMGCLRKANSNHINLCYFKNKESISGNKESLRFMK